MNLVLDLGNTFAKIGWFEQEVLKEVRYKIPLGELPDLLSKQRPEAAIIASTGLDTQPFAEKLTQKGTQAIQLTPHTRLPIVKMYDTPHTLGADRVAAAAGAQSLFPGEDCLVIDMGTCITYDWVSRAGAFEGGIISPGLRMRFRAMHTFTKRLPLIEIAHSSNKEWPALVGKTTQQCMESGVFNALQAEIEGIIARYEAEKGTCRVLLCGGDAPFFENRLKTRIFATPNLVLIGLNRILLHNVNLLKSKV